MVGTEHEDVRRRAAVLLVERLADVPVAALVRRRDASPWSSPPRPDEHEHEERGRLRPASVAAGRPGRVASDLGPRVRFGLGLRPRRDRAIRAATAVDPVWLLSTASDGYVSRLSWAKTVIGVDLGGTKILAGLVDATDDGAASRGRDAVDSRGGAARRARRAVRELLDDDVEAIGFGIPSRIDQRTGRAVGSVNVPLADLDFRDG